MVVDKKKNFVGTKPADIRCLPFVVYGNLLQRIKRHLPGEEVKGVGVMKDEDLQLEVIEVSHTLGGYRYYSTVRYTIVNRSHRIGRKGKGLVNKNHETVWIRDRGV